VLSVGIRQVLLRTYEARTVEMGATLVGYLGAHVAAGTPMSAEERALLDDIHPLDDKWKYLCFSIVPTLFDERFDREALARHRQALLPLFLELTRRKPQVTLDHIACTSAMIWKLSQGNELTNGPFMYETAAGKITTIHEAPDAPAFSPVFPELGQWMLRSVVSTFDRDISWLFWRPAVPLYLVFLACAVACLRRRSWRPAALLVPLFLHTLALLLLINSQDLRYQYPVFLMSQMFCLGWLLLPCQAVTQARPAEAPEAAPSLPVTPALPQAGQARSQ
jgi:hypothetical protein